MTVADNALLSFGDSADDEPFSIGCAFNYYPANAALKILIAKWDDITPLAEYRLYLDAAEKINLVLFDNSVANASRGRLYNTALTAHQWYVAIATYSGVGGASAEDGITIYLRTCGAGRMPKVRPDQAGRSRAPDRVRRRLHVGVGAIAVMIRHS